MAIEQSESAPSKRADREAAPRVSFEDTSVAFSYKNDQELRRANTIFSMVNHPWMSALGIAAVKIALALHLPVEGIIKRTAFDHFCGGVSLDSCDDEIAVLSKYGVGTILDYSVEGEASDAGFDRTMEETLRAIRKAAANPRAIPFSVFKVTGLAPFDLLEKLHAKGSLSIEEQARFTRVRERVDAICSLAYASHVPVLIDAEESWIQDPIDTLAREMMETYNRERVVVFNTFQLYRKSALSNLERAVAAATAQRYRLGAKLVRGAYMEKERERAKEKGYESPIWPNKEATDQAFDDALAFCVSKIDHLAMMCGSHNEESNQKLTTLMRACGLPNDDERVWFAQLFGMSDNISFNLARSGYRVAKYMPYGPVRSVMPYLFRRAQENTSVAGQSSRELVLIRKELERRKAAGKV
jgi:proline dehydrogenase